MIIEHKPNHRKYSVRKMKLKMKEWWVIQFKFKLSMTLIEALYFNKEKNCWCVHKKEELEASTFYTQNIDEFTKYCQERLNIPDKYIINFLEIFKKRIGATK